MIMVGGAVEVTIRQLVQRLHHGQRESPARRPLLDPSRIALDGDLVLVGARHLEDAQRVMLTMALEAAHDRELLVIAADAARAKMQAASIVTGFPAESLASLTSQQGELLDWSKEIAGDLPIRIVDATMHAGGAGTVWSWLRKHRNGVVILLATWPALLGRDEDDIVTFLCSMKELAREASGAVVVPWGLKVDGRPHQHSRLCDLAMTDAAEEHADVVVLFSELEDRVRVTLAKNRHGPTGCLYDSQDDY